MISQLIKMKRRTTIILLALFGSLNAQVLKLDDAISTALANNHGVVIAKQQAESNKTDIHPGAVGFLPTVDALGNASYNYSVTDQEFNISTFPAVENQEASQSNQSAKLSASYLIFNGGSRVRSYAKLKASGDLFEMQTKITIESTIVQVVNAYFDVVRLNNQLELVKESMSLSGDRLKREKVNKEFGNSARIDVLNAQVDFNNDSVNYINAKISLRKAKNEVNFLLGRKIADDFEVVSQIEVPSIGDVETYIQKSRENNTTIMLSNIQLNMAEMDKKISQSNLMPVLSTNVDYGYQGSASDIGVFKSSSSLGFTAGVSLRWNLFDGLKKQKALEKAKINIELNNTKQQQSLLNIEKEVQNYYDALVQNISLLELEMQNEEVAQLNFERSQDLFKNGSISSLQFRQAQLNVLQVSNRANNISYAIKVYEYQLLRMTNELVK